MPGVAYLNPSRCVRLKSASHAAVASASTCTRDALARGETAERLFLLDAWRESPLYGERERAALAWTEAVTLVAQTHAPDAAYEEIRQHFTEEEQVKLSLLIATINAWNRISIGFRSVHPVKSTA